MKTLRTSQGIRIELESYDTDVKLIRRSYGLGAGKKILFSGTRSELMEKPEEFWREIIEPFDAPFVCYKDYSDDEESFLYFHKTAKESGLSVLEDMEGDWFIITEEQI